MTDLRDDLRTLGTEIAWPATPDLTATIRALPDQRGLTPSVPHRYKRGQTPSVPGRYKRGQTPWRRARGSRRLVVVIAAILLALPAAAMAIPASRHAILDAFGLRHVTVERRTTVPHAATDRQLGDAVALPAGALVPARLGRPDAVYRRAHIITLVYDHPRVLLAQARGALPDANVLRKMIAMDDRARRTTVGGRPAVFLADPHAYQWTDATGPVLRSGPALIWERGDTVLRLEGERDLARARAIAASVS